MIIIRYLTSFLFSIIMIILTMFFGFVCSLLPYFPNLACYLAQQYGYLVIHAARYLCGIRYQIHGIENIPKNHRFIIFSKHQSTWETLFLLFYFPKMSIILKKELLSIPFFGWGLRALRPIAIDRNAGRAAITELNRQGEIRLQQGLSILCFPEGTRKFPGDAPDYKVGGAMLASKTEAPILPIALNSGECWPRKGFLKKPGIISVIIGPCIETKDKKTNAILQEAQDWIEGEMIKINFTANFHQKT
ncbi:MAG: 1-acyl-sn-glycerol-3-phosphate acyltransferase [Gammaproteobacteria bacterium]|nr:1-acyl-sn-glycerol-3-phosphate acyltransferase [Gammaproteobacteria bacterium]